MSNQQNDYDLLDQYNDPDEGYLDKVIEEYSNLVGLFLIKFSILEDQLNETVANFINDRTHEVGFAVIERLSMSNKIDLFHKLHIRFGVLVGKGKQKERLKKLTQQLRETNSFRNNIVHANWQSLSSDKLVRTKIVVDNEEGYIKFRKVKMSPKTIKRKVEEIEKITQEICNFEAELE